MSTELLVWAVINLIVPLLAIGLIAADRFFADRAIQLDEIVSDGQLCFYAAGIVVAGYYDLWLATKGVNIGGMTAWAALVGLLSLVGYAMFATEHEGAAQFVPRKVAIASAILALAAFSFAYRAHQLIS